MARALVIEERADGVYLTRSAESGELAGETWHAGLADALHQAQFEYGVGPGDWDVVPTDPVDPLITQAAPTHEPRPEDRSD